MMDVRRPVQRPEQRLTVVYTYCVSVYSEINWSPVRFWSLGSFWLLAVSLRLLPLTWPLTARQLLVSGVSRWHLMFDVGRLACSRLSRSAVVGHPRAGVFSRTTDDYGRNAQSGPPHARPRQTPRRLHGRASTQRQCGAEIVWRGRTCETEFVTPREKTGHNACCRRRLEPATTRDDPIGIGACGHHHKPTVRGWVDGMGSGEGRRAEPERSSVG